MIATTNERQGNVPYLDGWRGVAILAVLLGHFGPARFWYMGRLGVVLFFVLSGLFMGRLLFIRKVPLSSFFVKRITRIVPALWVYVGTMWFYAAYIQPVPYRPQGAEFLSMLSFSSTYLYSIWEMQWPVSQLWSLNVEEHGYVFLALGTVLIAKSKERLSASVFLGVSMLAVMGCIVLYMRGRWQVEGSPWRTRSEVASLGLIASAYFCVMNETGRMKFLHKFSWLPLAALALALASFLPYGNFSWNFSILVAPLLAAFAVNHAASFPETVKRILSIRMLRWFGTCSFSIYLWQGPFYVATKKFGASPSLCLVFGVVAGALSYYTIENPARLFWNRKWDEFRAAKSGGIAETVA